MKTAKQNIEVLTTLKTHIAMGLEISDTEDEAMEMQIRIAEIDAEFKTMLQGVAADTIESFDEEKATRLMTEAQTFEFTTTDGLHSQAVLIVSEADKVNDLLTTQAQEEGAK